MSPQQLEALDALGMTDEVVDCMLIMEDDADDESSIQVVAIT